MVVDLDMRFGTMVGFAFKWFLASALAGGFLLALVGGVLTLVWIAVIVAAPVSYP